MQQGEKIKPFINEKGRKCFNYGQGAKYLCEDMTSVDQVKYIVYQIERCEYRNGTEYYHIKRDGRALPNAITANRLHYILNFTLVDVLDEGERQELPLTMEDIREYFAAQKSMREQARKIVEQEIEKNEEYKQIAKRINHLAIFIAFGEMKGEDVTKHEQELKNLQAYAQAKLKRKGVDPEILKDKHECPYCMDTGIYRGRICVCAQLIEEDIKDYIANR